MTGGERLANQIDLPSKKPRANYVGSPAYLHLNNACILLNDAFNPIGSYGCFHVGSSLAKRDFRDVDIRIIMRDEDYDRLFPNDGEETQYRSAFWSLLRLTISDWLSKASGLPVDFQIQ